MGKKTGVFRRLQNSARTQCSPQTVFAAANDSDTLQAPVLKP